MAAAEWQDQHDLTPNMPKPNGFLLPLDQPLALEEQNGNEADSGPETQNGKNALPTQALDDLRNQIHSNCREHKTAGDGERDCRPCLVLRHHLGDHCRVLCRVSVDAQAPNACDELHGQWAGGTGHKRQHEEARARQ
mmetsp:Transcript_100458/g.193939  ORF Transcript_100458/g.193939 Transcript_100458/m.193939 type:complete len:137 (-) Transcript_100458:1381-1791(-)